MHVLRLMPLVALSWVRFGHGPGIFVSSVLADWVR